MLEAGVWSAYQLEKTLSPHQVYRAAEGTVRPCRWDKYRRGDNTPSVATRAFIAGRFRGAQNRWDSPIWRIFKGEVPSRSDIVHGLANLVPDIAMFLTEQAGGNTVLQPISADFFDLIEQTVSYDTFETMVLIAVLADIIHDEQLREVVTNIYRLRRRDLMEDHIISRLHSELFGYADTVCRPRWRTSRGEIVYIDFPWSAGYPYRQSGGKGR